jgi:hypothetical protein
MREAVGYLVAVAIGYALGAAHVWLTHQAREGSAYMDGYRTGQIVAGRSPRHAERAK